MRHLLTRREALRRAGALGAALAWAPGFVSAASSRRPWRERRDCFPQGVASADPHPNSVLVWTRRPPTDRAASRLVVEVARDSEFNEIVATATAKLSAENDWTCRVLAAGLQPSTEYWYRFVDSAGFGSRIGRTRTAPAPGDERPIRFAFVSCQNVTQGACNAYRRMIFEDTARAFADQIEFVLHLGDFVYEVVWYPEDRPQGMYDRRLRDIVRYPTGEKITDFHVPATLEDYRSLYRAYLSDPDLQDAKARWPFVCVWDNHEFSWKGWQAQQSFGGESRPAQRRKVFANQAWFEYQPARVEQAARTRGDRFVAPAVHDAPIERFDADGLGLDPANVAAIDSLIVYRALRWGKHVDLVITDNRSFRSEPIADRADFVRFRSPAFPFFIPQDVIEILDAGKTYPGGAPETISFGGGRIPNPRLHSPAQSMLGRRQKAWFLDRLRQSKTTWKLWANSVAMLNWRIDLQNLPSEKANWPSTGYAQFGSDDWSGYVSERNEILEHLRDANITGLINIAGDRHAFLSGLLSVRLPPKSFVPVSAEFVVGSVSAPGLAEAAKYAIARDHPFRSIYLYDADPAAQAQSALNISSMHGVRAAATLQQTRSVTDALAVRNPDVAPHLWFADAGGHGYAVVRADAAAVEVEFVCIPRPIERATGADGGPLAYRIAHRVLKWSSDERPVLERTRLEGSPPIMSWRAEGASI